MHATGVLILVIIVAVLVASSVALVTQPFVRAVKSDPPGVDAKRLEAHVRYLSVDLYPRSYDQPGRTERAVQYILKEFTGAGAAVSIQEYPVQEAKYKNVVARFGPASGPLIVVGAHYDSHGYVGETGAGAARYTPDTHTPGADDNASGVAELIELAYLLGRSPRPHSIELVAYALEEPPHFRTEAMGSAVHARLLRGAGRDVPFMLSLEMIGYFSDAPGSQAYPVGGMSYLYADRGDFVALVGKLSDFQLTRRIKAAMAGATSLPVHSINAPPVLQGIDFSDHLSYWQHGFPAFMITDTAFLRNPNYHRAGDTWDKLDYGRMAKVVQAVYAVTRAP